MHGGDPTSSARQSRGAWWWRVLQSRLFRGQLSPAPGCVPSRRDVHGLAVGAGTIAIRVPRSARPHSAILDAPPVPSALLSPTGDRLVLLHPRAMPTIAEMAEPVRCLAGVRFVAASGGRVGGLSYAAASVAGLDGRPSRPVAIPLAGADRLLPIGFSPDAPTTLSVSSGRTRFSCGSWSPPPRRHDRCRAFASTPRSACAANGWTTAAPSCASPCQPTVAPSPPLRPRPSGPNIQETRGDTNASPARIRTCSRACTTNNAVCLLGHATSTISVVPGLWWHPALPSAAPALYTIGQTRRPGGPLPSWWSRSNGPLSHGWCPTMTIPKPRTHSVDFMSGTEVYSLAEAAAGRCRSRHGVPTGPRRLRVGSDAAGHALTWVVALDEGDPEKKTCRIGIG